MERPRVADGGDGLQIWRVAANILNKQSRTAEKSWSSSLGVGRGANKSLHGNEPSVYMGDVEFLDWMCDYWLLKRDSAIWDWLVGWLVS